MERKLDINAKEEHHSRMKAMLTVSKGAPRKAISYFSVSALSLKQLTYGRFAKVVKPLKALPLMISTSLLGPNGVW